MKDRPDLDLDVEEECIVPIIKFFLEDANQEVGKTAYSHLAVMINRGKISKREYYFLGHWLSIPILISILTPNL